MEEAGGSEEQTGREGENKKKKKACYNKVRALPEYNKKSGMRSSTITHGT